MQRTRFATLCRAQRTGVRLGTLLRRSASSDRLGLPFSEFLFYPDLPDVCVAIRIVGDAVTLAKPPEAAGIAALSRSIVRATVIGSLGTPAEICWEYSRSPGGRYYRGREVCFTSDRVTGIVREWLRD